MSKTKANTPVESIRHKDNRKNIPTEELRRFVAEEEQCEDHALPTAPSLDPHRENPAVPVVPPCRNRGVA